MSKQKVEILDKERINRKLQRMAYEIWEHNSHEKEVVLIGIAGSGEAVANNLAQRLKTISTLKVEVLSMKLNKRNPLSEEIKLSANLGGKSVIVVDDVANSGKTLLYAVRAILDHEVKKIQVAVLVDRKHKAFPVSSDIVGHSVATTIQEHIAVETKGNEITAAYLM
jgi:pyrimidine operon attenuation protein/uracil phosphoribosyltransferase